MLEIYRYFSNTTFLFIKKLFALEYCSLHLDIDPISGSVLIGINTKWTLYHLVLFFYQVLKIISHFTL